MKLRRKLLNWHRWIGLLSAIFVLLLASTGLLLNHTTSFKLDQTFLYSKLSQLFYGVSFPEPIIFRSNENHFVQTENGMIYRNRLPIVECGDLVGVVTLDQQVVLACSQELILLTEAGEILERLGSTYSLPSPVESIGSCESTICILSGGQTYSIDIEALRWQLSSAENFDWSRSTALNLEDIDFYASEQSKKSISIERWILDLHSGRIGGKVGVFIVDLMAFLFIFSAITGLVIWFLGARRNRN